MATIDQVTLPAGSSSQPSHWMSGSAAPDASGATGTAPDGSLYFRHDPTTGAQLGSGVYEKLPAFTTGGPVWRPLSVDQVINVKRFGARGDQSADDSAAINAALAAARAAVVAGYPSGAPAVYIPAGVYRIDTPLNMTGTQLNLVGDGMFQTVLVGNTGSGKPVIDMAGAAYSSVRELSIVTTGVASATGPGVSAPATPSTYGITWARLVLSGGIGQMDMNLLERVQVLMHTDTTANGNYGTIALYNCGSEVSGVRGCALRADSALVLTADNFTGFSSNYATVSSSGVSMTVFETDSTSELIGLGKATVYIRGGGAFRILSFLANQYSYVGLAGPYPFAVEVVADTYDLHLSGSVETCPVSLGVKNAQIRGLRYHHYHAHGVYRTTPPALNPGEFVNTQWFSNIWLENSTVLHSTIQPCPTAGNYMGGSPDRDFLIDGINSTIGSSLIYAYGTQDIRLNPSSTGVSSQLLASLVLTDSNLADFTIEGSPRVLGTQVAGADGFRPLNTGMSRPSAGSVAAGTEFYDTSIHKPVWSDGTSWRDAAGTVVP